MPRRSANLYVSIIVSHGRSFGDSGAVHNLRVYTHVVKRLKMAGSSLGRSISLGLLHNGSSFCLASRSIFRAFLKNAET